MKENSIDDVSCNPARPRGPRFRARPFPDSPTLTCALICLALVAAGAAVATAQTRPEPSLDLSVGYQVLHIPGQTYPLGMSLEVSGALTRIVRVVAEAGVSVARGTTSNYGAGTLTLYDYGGGPRVTARAGRVAVYGQLLGGGVRTHADLTTASGAPFIEGDSAFMLQPGAGVIVPLSRKIAAIGEVNCHRAFFKEYGVDTETRVFLGVRMGIR